MKMTTRKLTTAVIAGCLALTIAQPAAAASRTWYFVNYADGKCELLLTLPLKSPFAHIIPGVTFDLPSSDNVSRDAQGNIHLLETGTVDYFPSRWDFFTSKSACDSFVVREEIQPAWEGHAGAGRQADTHDGVGRVLETGLP